jgi:uncharacterized protein (TIGR00369 family)
VIDAEHHRKLERAYKNAPVSRWYGVSARIEDGEAEIRVTIRPEFLHAAGAVHGSVYFRLLDDAAFFAVNSRVPDVFVLTVSFTVQLARPATSGELRSKGRVMHGGGRLFFAESDLMDEKGSVLAHGSGVFTKSSIPLDEKIGYV